MHASADLASPGLGRREQTSFRWIGMHSIVYSSTHQCSGTVLNLESDTFLRRSIEDRKRHNLRSRGTKVTQVRRYSDLKDSIETSYRINHSIREGNWLHTIDISSILGYFSKGYAVRASSPADSPTFLATHLCSWGVHGKK